MNPKLAFLRARFSSSLLVRIAQMREAIDAISPRGSHEAEETLARMFHSLAGIGGTYGYPEITFLSRAGEEAVRAADRRSAAARVALLRAIVDGIAAAGSGIEDQRAHNVA